MPSARQIRTASFGTRGNLGMIVGTMGVPLLFQSTWSIVPAGLSVIALIVRTQLEDDLLTKELDGYRD
jgi:protein-S-isoprenylcysteine O-methyltransferase Ste14